MPNATLDQNLPSLASIVVGGASPLENRQPLFVTPDLPLAEVISLMSQAKGYICLLPDSDPISSNRSLEMSAAARHSSVLVLADDRLVGIFTERDLVKLIASQADLQSVTVGDVMTIDPITLELSENHTVMTALGMFQQHQVRHLTILDDRQQPIGIVTPEHIRQVLQPVNLLKLKLVSEEMTREVIHALPTATVLEVARIMTDRNIGSIVIVDGQEPLKPVGIITERDLVQFQAFGLDLDQLLVEAVMSSPLFCLQPTDSLWAAQQVMQTKNIRRLIITNNRGELAGILTQSNLLQLLDPLEMLYMVDSLQSKLFDRAAELEQINRELLAEVARREQVEAELLRASQTLTERVVEKTSEAAFLTEELHSKIAEKQSSDIALEASQQGISDFIDNALIGMHWVDIEGNIIWVNQAELNMFGYDRSQYLGQPLINFHIDRSQVSNVLQRLLKNETIKNWEAQVYRKDGSICDVSIDAHAFFKHDKFIHARCFTRDISDQKKAEAMTRKTLDSLQFQKYALDRSAIVAATDRDGKIISVNDKFCEISQYSASELIGQTHSIINSGYHPPEFFRDLWAVITSGQVWTGEIKNRAKDGSYYWVATTIVPCLDQSGQPFQYLSIRFDITLRKQSEESVKESEARYRALLTTAPVGIFQTDKSGNCLFVNQQWMQLTGLSMSAAAGAGWMSAIHPDDRARVFADWERAVQAEPGFALEYRFMTPQGRVNWVSGNAIAIYDEAINIIGYLGTVNNITDRKQLEQERERFLAVGSDLQVIADSNGYYRWVSPTFEPILGWAKAEMTSRPWIEFIHPDDINSSVAEAASLFDDNKTIGFENRYRHKDGSYRWLSWKAQSYTEEQVIYAVAVDITEKKQLEQQFLRAQRLESLGSLASGIAHDLNNVLTPIVGAAQLLPLMMPNLDVRSQRLLNMLVESSKRGSGLVKQILTFVRGIDGERAAIQVRHILAEIISVARQTFPVSIEIELNLDSENLWLVNVDPTQIHQVFMNLFVNARDAMPNGGQISASAENITIDAESTRAQIQPPVGSYILITISDTGIGMNSEILERIFDPFFTTKATGTGLGLSTVQGIVKTHGGSIEVESEVGQGTSFKIYLPAIVSRETETPTVDEDRYDGKGQLVLVVDDEMAIREITKESLETYNYRVMLASDGIEAIDIYAQNDRSIAIVLIDMMMPHLDTPSIVTTLHQINPAVKIVVMSGSHFNLESSVDGSQVSGVINKPFATTELLQILANI